MNRIHRTNVKRHKLQRSLTDTARKLANALKSKFAEHFSAHRPHTLDVGQTFVPTLVPLEPRIVLNATAELSSALGLSVFGDAADDEIRLEVVENGTAIRVYDSSGVIPITGHNGGISGSETDPLAISQIAGGNVSVELGAGDDILRLQLPDAIQLNVDGGAGIDRIEVDVVPASSPSPPSSISINADQIDFSPSGGAVQFADRDFQLFGDVTIGSAFTSGATSIDVGNGSFTVDGRLSLDGSVRLTGSDTNIDFSSAVISATAPNAGLFVQLTSNPNAQVVLGQIDESAGSSLDELSVVSASVIQLNDDVSISGGLFLDSESQIRFNADIDAASVQLQSESITGIGTIVSNNGTTVLNANQMLDLAVNIDTSAALELGNVSLSGTTVVLDNVSVDTARANVEISGAIEVSQTLSIETVGPSGSGNVTFAGPVSSIIPSTLPAPIEPQGSLVVDASGSSGGVVTLSGNVADDTTASMRDLRSLVISAEQIAVQSVGVTGGTIQLQASQTQLLGNLRTTNGSTAIAPAGDASIQISGDLLVTGLESQLQSASSINVSGAVAAATATNNISLFAVEEIAIQGAIAGGNELRIDSGTQLRLFGDVDQWRSVSLSGNSGISASMSRLEAAEQILVNDDITFSTDTTIRTAIARFDGSITVEDAVTVQLDSVLVDSAEQSTIEKRGTGELVLQRESEYSQRILVTAGTLRVDAPLTDLESITVTDTAILASSSSIAGTTHVLSGGRLSPNASLGNIGTAQAGFEILELDTGSVYEVDVEGPVLADQHDSISVAGVPLSGDASLQLNNATLSFNFEAVLQPDTEILIAENDRAIDALGGFVQGNFAVNFDTDGNALATPRILNEGDLVLTEFGLGAAVPAFITYFGGDGNDVAIVTAGDRVQPAGNVTLVTRRGSDLEIRSGDSVADAENNSPTVRPIAGLNGNTLVVNALAPNAQLIVDINGFVDPTSAALHFDATIDFQADAVGGNASVTLFDSDTTTTDTPGEFTINYASANEIEFAFDHDEVVAPGYSVIASGASELNLRLASNLISINLSDGDDVASFSDSARPGSSQMSLLASGQSSLLRFELPDQTLIVNGQSGNDQLTFESMDQSFVAVPKLFGSAGQDSINWNADVSIGAETLPQTLDMDFENIRIAGEITLQGGGDIAVNATTELEISSLLNSAQGQIRIHSDATLGDLTGSHLQSYRSDDAAVVLSGNEYVLGDIVASDGNVILGNRQTVGAIGNVSQAIGSSIESLVLDVDAEGMLRLDSLSNQLDLVQVLATGSVTLFDSQGDLDAGILAGSEIQIRSAGNVTVNDVQSSGSNVQLFAAGDLIAGNFVSENHVSGQLVELTVATAFPGQALAPGLVSNIGASTTPLQVAASSSLSATTGGSNGSIFLSGNRLPIGLIDAGSGRVELSAGSIDDDNQTPSVDLIGDSIVLDAANGIGANDTLTTSELSRLSASSEMGSIRIDVQADRTVTLDDISTGGGDGSEILIQHTGLDRLSVGSVRNQDGDVRLVTEFASIDVLDRTPLDSIFVGGTGNLSIQNRSGSGDITIRGNVTSDLGDIDIASRRNIAVTPSSTIRSRDGHLALSAGNRGNGLNATIDLQDGSTIDARLGTTRLTSPGNVFVSSIESGNSGEAIVIESVNGALIDSGDQEIDLIADAGSIRIDVASGIGDSDALETEIESLTAVVRGDGLIQINETTDIELLDVETHAGAIDIVAQGMITATRVQSTSAGEFDSENTPADHDIRLTTIQPQSDIRLGEILSMNGSDVRLNSADDVLNENASSLILADDLAILSLNATGDQNDAIRIRTNVDQFEASVLGSARGNLVVVELDSIQLAASDRQDDMEVVSTRNGEIRISAGHSISISDPGGVDDSVLPVEATRLDTAVETIEASLRSDVEIIADGDHGRIQLLAAESLMLGNQTQLAAQQSTIESVVLTAPQIMLGVDFQIETGEAIGVARQFAPRPTAGLTETAFYDSNSISTNRLEQAAVNDAMGILTVDVGSIGERGLTINIDWGAQTDRFQQIDSLSGDAPPLSVSHLYLEEDILSSSINGRTSATEPLEVRFSVRHHESILIQGESIEQFESGVQLVDGEVISSTDNPLTRESAAAATLESGRAQFIIPNLSIPVAFFPVRDVIPEFENDPIIKTTEQTVTLIGATVETTSTTPSSTPSRDEYFQIRMLSPDPNGEDLVAPTRLPEDIIGGDKLKRLLASLPDGRYDIQYVLGDGNVRSILTVDVRDGKPTVQQEDLDGGIMRLRPIESGNLPDDADSETLPGTSDDSEEDESLESAKLDDNPPLSRLSASRIDSSDRNRNDHTNGDQPLAEPNYTRFSVAGRLRSKGLEIQHHHDATDHSIKPSDEPVRQSGFEDTGFEDTGVKS